jgi:preprotein translocase subunit SecE
LVAEVATETKKMAKSAVGAEPDGGSKRDRKDSANSAIDRFEPVKARTAQMGEFFHDVRSEMKKVSTPTREQVQATTLVVLITVFVFALYFWLVDNFLRYSLDKFIYRFSHH